MTIENTSTPYRIASIDLLRGLVMIIMALDHSREFFHYAGYFFDPTDPARTTVPIFLTRFITHFCAPAFSFLSGLSAFITGQRKNLSELSGFLLRRGLWLVFIEFTIMNFGEHFDLHFRDNVFETIWSLGISMIVLAGLIHLPKKYIVAFSVILIFGHNLLDAVHFENSFIWSLLHERGGHDIIPGHSFFVAYPVIPWIGVMSLGYCFGSFYESSFDPGERTRLFNWIGVGSIALLFILRTLNFYGDLFAWRHFENNTQTFISFLRFNKYPPSLDFLLLTLGGSFIVLANSEKAKGKIVNFLSVFGRVPFFYYVIHIYLIHFLALCAAGLTGFGWQKMIITFDPADPDPLRGFGFNLAIVYLIWIIVVVTVYPFCKRFDQYKQQNKGKWWLSYL